MKRTAIREHSTPPPAKRARLCTQADRFDVAAAADTCRAHSTTRLCSVGASIAAVADDESSSTMPRDHGPMVLLLLAHHHLRSLLTDAEYRHVARVATSAPDLPSGTKGRLPLHSLRIALQRSPEILERVHIRLWTTVPLHRA